MSGAAPRRWQNICSAIRNIAAHCHPGIMTRPTAREKHRAFGRCEIRIHSVEQRNEDPPHEQRNLSMSIATLSTGFLPAPPATLVQSSDAEPCCPWAFPFRCCKPGRHSCFQAQKLDGLFVFLTLGILFQCESE